MSLSGVGDFVLFLGGLIGCLRIGRPRGLDVLAALYQVLEIGWRPVVIVAVPFGMVFALNFDSLLGLVGARSQAGAGLVPAVVRETGPLLAAVVASATVGAAFCADLGARKIRDELDASQVMAVDPRSRIYVPRIVACTLGVPILAVFGTMAALIGGWALIVLLRAGDGGLYLAGFEVALRSNDVFILLLKSALNGMLIGIAACYFGSHAKGGPSGVASATRTAIISGFAVTFLADFVLNQIFYTPQ